MWPRRGLIATLGIMALAGCASSDSIGIAGGVNLWSDPFHDDDWIYYYDEGDEYFLTGLTDEEKDALKKEWDALPPEEKRQIRDRWNDLSDDERSRVRQSWGGLDAGQRQQVVASMDARARDGTLRPVIPVQARPSLFQATPGGGFDRSRPGTGAGSFDRGGFGGRGGGFGGRGGGFGGRGGGGGRGR
jgi:hypothetical protein